MKKSIEAFALDHKVPLNTSAEDLVKNGKQDNLFGSFDGPQLFKGHEGKWNFYWLKGAETLPPQELNTSYSATKDARKNFDEAVAKLSEELGTPVFTTETFSKIHRAVWGERLQGSIEARLGDTYSPDCEIRIYNRFELVGELSHYPFLKEHLITYKKDRLGTSDLFSSPLPYRGYHRHYIKKFTTLGTPGVLNFFYSPSEEKLGLYDEKQAFILPKKNALSLVRLAIPTERGESPTEEIYLMLLTPNGTKGLARLLSYYSAKDALLPLVTQLSEAWGIPHSFTNDPTVAMGTL